MRSLLHLSASQYRQRRGSRPPTSTKWPSTRSWLLSGWMEDLHLSSCGWMPRLHGPVNHTPSEGYRSDWREPEEAEKGSLWLWLRRKEKCWGEKQLTPKTAKWDDTDQLQGVTGRRPCHCSTSRRRSRIKGAKRW